ncbi:MAG TPA: arylsulfatase [Polyangiaceae bacterium]|nr:arylsulfatase [Polyangiaceae bacterium]
MLLVAACSDTGATSKASDGNDVPAAAGTSGTSAGGGGSPATAGTSAGGSADGGTPGTAGSSGAGGDSAGNGGSAGAATSDRPPNVLIVLLDDLGYSDLGAYGSEIRTPSIDQLAEGGTRFRNFYVTPRCSPTRISLLTGQYTQQVATEPGASLPPLRTDNNVTLPELLSAAGYRTYMAGKWHLGTDPDQLPRSRGFDHVFSYTVSGPDKWDKSVYNLDSKNDAIAARVYGDGPRDFYQSTAIGDYALDFLSFNEAQDDDAPFFMYLAFNAPHFPVQADRALIETAADGEPSYLDLYAQGWGKTRNDRYQRMLNEGVIDSSYGLSASEPFNSSEIPKWSTLSDVQQADLTRKMALYAGAVEGVDAALGRIVAALEASGEFDNTLIFVLSDNGGNYEGGIYGSAFKKTTPLTGADLENMGQPGQKDHVLVGGGWAHHQNTPFRLFKHYTHGGGVRSPLVVSWPAKVAKPGSFTDQVAHVIDLAPTILEVAHVSYPDQYAGRDVLPLEGASLASTLDGSVAPFARQLGFEHETNRAWIDGSMKLVVRHETGDVPELYDLSTDPSELDDLAAAEPDTLSQMVQAWNEWAAHVGVPSDRLLP